MLAETGSDCIFLLLMPSRITTCLTALCLAVVNCFAQATALSVNTAVREEVRQFYRAIYYNSPDSPMAWTGTYSTNTPGDTSSLFKESTRLRINFYRALVGVPADIMFAPVYNQKAQRAALMMSLNDALSHFPDSTWIGYTPEGAEAAGKSNLALGSAGPEAIDGYMADAGANNSAVGHRRWLFYPQTLLMGTGDVPGNSLFERANALWVIDDRIGTPRPTTRTTHVAYPPAGYIPYSLVWPRWSFSYPGADFSVATVAMRRNGVDVPVVREPVKTDIGEPTLVWIYDGKDPDSDAPHPRPATDTLYTVYITSVRIAGVLRNFEYNVRVFDPDQPSEDATLTTITGPGNPAIGIPNAYTVAKPPFGSGFEWRFAQTEPTTPLYTAESGLGGLLAKTTPGYEVVQSRIFSSGGFAYRLAHLSPRADEILQLSGTFLVASNSAITFQSRLAIATPIETARVQVSVDGGISWIDLYRQAGTSATNATPQPTENSFVPRTISLAAFAGRTVEVRLVFSIEQSGTAFVPEATNNVGWFVDTLALTNVQRVTASAPTAVISGNTFAYTAPVGGTVNLQARGLMFGFPLEWGPIKGITATADGSNPNASYLSNLSVRTTAGTESQTLIAGFNITGGTKSLLVRGIGPALTPFGVANALLDPTLDLYRGTSKIAGNDNWRAEDRALFQSVGAFELATNSRDAALVTTPLDPGSYTVQVSGVGNTTGNALVELYDTGNNTNGARLTNLSARSSIASGNDVLIAGFNIAGTSERTLLIRAIGPALSLFSVPGPLSNPRLQLYGSDQRLILENDRWDPAVAPTFDRVGAFQLPNGSQDAALLVTLPPGSYTAQVSGIGGSTGVALIEVYDVP